MVSLGVEEVKVDSGANKVTVTGKKLDPAVLKEKVEAKTHKQVVVVSPQPSNKGGDKAKDGGGGGGGDGGEKQKKKEDKKGGDSKEESKGEDDKKKAKEKEVLYSVNLCLFATASLSLPQYAPSYSSHCFPNLLHSLCLLLHSAHPSISCAQYFTPKISLTEFFKSPN